ncbi:MAG: cupin domain-containing protein [Chromatocurvus sp.]
MSHPPSDIAMRERLVRYADLKPCRNAFVDTYTPGSHEKENFTIIGPGVSENPDQYVHIPEPHGFNIGGARQPPGCVNSQHSHVSEEVFVVHSGRWAFRWGVAGSDGEAILTPGDCISIPVNVFRGFENVGEGIGYLFAVLGGDDPGRVLWAPDVFDKASEYGLVLLENGNLVDTTRGEEVPDDVRPMPRTSAAQVAAHRIMTSEEMRDCVCTDREQQDATGIHTDGVAEKPVIGDANPAEDMPAGKLSWPHGFHLRRLELSEGRSTPMAARGEPEVLFVHQGQIQLHWDGGELALQSGDVFTAPIGVPHAYRHAGGSPAVVFVVRGGDHPSAARRSEV